MKIKILIDYTFALLGCICLSIGIVIFLSQNQIAAGGPPGIAILLNHLSDISIGTAIILINLPLLIMGYKKFGKHYIFKTLVIILITSLFTDLLSTSFSTFKASNDQLLNAIFGGIFCGCGLGLMFKSGGSAGGWSILAQLFSNLLKQPVGKVMFLLDSIVICSSILIFNNLETALYGAIGVYVSSKIVDVMIIGNVSIKSVHISCKSANTLIPLITEKLNSPGTIIECKQYGSMEKKDLIFIAIQQDKITKLQNIIIKQDPSAYIIVTDARVLIN